MGFGKSALGAIGVAVLAAGSVGILLAPKLLAHPTRTADIVEVPSPTPFVFTSPWESPSPSPLPAPSVDPSAAPATPAAVDPAPATAPPAAAATPAAPPPPAIDHLTVEVVYVPGDPAHMAVTIRAFPQDVVVSGACGSLRIQSPANGYAAIDDTYNGCTAAPPAWAYNHYLFAVDLIHVWAKGMPWSWSAQFTYQGVSVTANG